MMTIGKPVNLFAFELARTFKLRRIVLALVLMILGSCAFGQLANSPWPKFHRDLRNSALGIGSGASPTIRWEVSGNFSPPIIGTGGVVYAGSGDGHLYAIDSQTGAIIWSTLLGGVVGTPALDQDGTLFVVAGPSVYAVDSSGNIKWSFETNSSVGAPTIDSTNGVYFGCYNYNVFCLDGSTGNVRWSVDAGGPASFETPAIGPDGTVYVPAFIYTHAYDPTSGAIKWEVETAGTPYLAALGTNNLLYSAMGYGGNATDTATGASVWSTSLPGFAAVGTALGPDGSVYWGSVRDLFYSVNGSNGNSNWQFAAGADISYDASVAADGTIYFGSGDGNFYALDPASGGIDWYLPIGGTGTAIDADGTLFVAANSGLVALEPAAPTPLALSLIPAFVEGQDPSTGVIKLSSPAPTGGLTVNLSTQYSAFARTPKSVVVPAGSTTVNFPISTGIYTQSLSNLIVASDGQHSSSATLNISSDSIQSISLSNPSISPNQVTTVTVTLNNPAPIGGWKVNLKSQSPQYLTVPSYVKVPYGATSTWFQVSPAQFSQPYNVTIQASDQLTSVRTVLNVNAGDTIASISLSPSNVVGGQWSQGTVTLSSPAPAGGWYVNFSTQTPNYVGIYPQIQVAAGSTTGTFEMWTTPYLFTYTCLIKATDGNSTQTATLTVTTGASIASLTLSPSTVSSGNPSTGTVTLNDPAPTGGWVVNLVTQRNLYIGIPGSITIAAGQTTGSFSITTRPYTATYSAIITASDLSSHANATITVTTSNSVKSLTISPNQVSAGSSATGTVTLTNPAPAEGWTVYLSTPQFRLIGLPVNVLTVPSGSSSITFTINTGKLNNGTNDNYTATIIATDYISPPATATLTVTP